jgi:hypothetical protein
VKPPQKLQSFPRVAELSMVNKSLDLASIHFGCAAALTAISESCHAFRSHL